MEPQLWFKPLISVSIVHHHVFLGLPCLWLPSGVQWSDVLESLSLLLSWPFHCHHLYMMVILMHLFALYIYKQILVGNGVKPENTKDFFADFWCGRPTAFSDHFWCRVVKTFEVHVGGFSVEIACWNYELYGDFHWQPASYNSPKMWNVLTCSVGFLWVEVKCCT